MSDFFGSTYDPDLDAERLTTLRARVHHLMLDGQWRTRPEIAQALGVSVAADIGRRIRELEAPAHGGWNVEKRRKGEEKRGVWEYRINGKLPEAGAEPVFSDPIMLRDDPEQAVLDAAREYAETMQNTDDPTECVKALERLGHAALALP